MLKKKGGNSTRTMPNLIENTNKDINTIKKESVGFSEPRSTIAKAKPSPKGSRHPFECRRIRKHNIRQQELYTSKRKVNEKVLGWGGWRRLSG